MPIDDFDSRLVELLRSSSVWQPVETPGPVIPVRIQELSTLGCRLANEERAAEAVLDSLAKTPAAWWRTAIIKSPAGRTAGMVRQLLDRMRSLVSKTPAQSLEMTSLAVELANDLSLLEYSSDFVISLRSDAWRDHAFMLHFLGRLPEAVAALDEAERLARETLLPQYGLARINLVRADILVWQDKRSEAVALAREAAETFLEFGDRAKYVTARTTEAIILYHNGSIREAVAIWEAIKDEESLDELARMMIIFNIGMAYRELGDPTKAVEHISVAIAEYELLGMNDAAARARWALATTLVSAGKFTPAIHLFEKVWKEFEELQLEADAALVALELAEALLVIGQPERVPQICRTLLDRFTRTGMTSRAITALSYLREVVAIGKVRPPVVRQVREFLRDLPSQGRPTLSLPPPERER